MCPPGLALTLILGKSRWIAPGPIPVLCDVGVWGLTLVSFCVQLEIFARSASSKLSKARRLPIGILGPIHTLLTDGPAFGRVGPVILDQSNSDNDTSTTEPLGLQADRRTSLALLSNGWKPGRRREPFRHLPDQELSRLSSPRSIPAAHALRWVPISRSIGVKGPSFFPQRHERIHGRGSSRGDV